MNIWQYGAGAAAKKQANFTYYANGQTNTVNSYTGWVSQDAVQVATGTYSYDADGRTTGLSYTHLSGSSYIPIDTMSDQAISYGLKYDSAANITQFASADGTDNIGDDAVDEAHKRQPELDDFDGKPRKRKLFFRRQRRPHRWRILSRAGQPHAFGRHVQLYVQRRRKSREPRTMISPRRVVPTP